jgi:hypothetical protein
MRKLWEDHITWTRLFIVSAAADLPDKDATTQRLLQNQVDIGNAIRPYYGDAAGDKLTALLKDHILGAAELVGAAKAGDTAAMKAASDKWYANANDIAAFLSSANPGNWPLGVMQAQMKMHLDLTVEEATAHLKGQFQADVAAYDKVHNHILGLADTLTAGIVNQFPGMFGGAPAPVVAGMPRTGGYERGTGTGLADERLVWLALAAGAALVVCGLFARRSARRVGGRVAA